MSRPTVIGVSVDGVTKPGTGKEDPRERIVFGGARPFPAGWTAQMAADAVARGEVPQPAQAPVEDQADAGDPLAGMDAAQLRALLVRLLPQEAKPPAPMPVPPAPHAAARDAYFATERAIAVAPVPSEGRMVANPEAIVGGVPGRKDDTGKIDMSLLMDMPFALEAVAEVLQWAITKKLPKPYTRGSWQGVRPFQQRYTAAQLRHEIAAAKAKLRGEEPAHFARDAETGLLELAHIATDAMFRLENAVRQLNGLAEVEA